MSHTIELIRAAETKTKEEDVLAAGIFDMTSYVAGGRAGDDGEQSGKAGAVRTLVAVGTDHVWVWAWEGGVCTNNYLVAKKTSCTVSITHDGAKRNVWLRTGDVAIHLIATTSVGSTRTVGNKAVLSALTRH